MATTLNQDITNLASNRSLDDCVSISNQLLKSLKIVQAELEKNKDQETPQIDENEQLLKLQSTIKTNWNDKVTKKVKSLNNPIKKLDKSMDKSFGGFNIDDIYNYKIDTKKDLTTSKTIRRAILIHLLRNGNFRQVDQLSKEFQFQIPAELTQKFRQLYQILQDLSIRHDLDSAISWCEQNKAKLVQIGSDLEFQLYKLKFIEISKVDKFKGLKFVQQHFASRFGFDHLDMMSQLVMKINVERCSAECSGHGKDDENVFDHISDQFIQVFSSIQGLSMKNPLYQVLTTSYLLLPSFVKFNKLINLKKLDWSTKNELPFEIELPQDLKFHSIFICPVSREETTLSNPPRVLPCMHILSQSTVMSLSKNNLNSSFKCPYCPKITRQSETKLVKFVNI